MAPNPRRIDAKLHELYDQLPEVKCSGACHNACGFVPVSLREKQRLEQLTGKKFETVDSRETEPGIQRFGPDNRPLARYRCSMLTEDGRCSVYDERPMICRLFGAAEGVECHRCGLSACEKPLTLSEGIAMLHASMKVGGFSKDVPDAFRELETHAVKLKIEEANEEGDLLAMMEKVRQEGNDRMARGILPRHGE
jgi:Fe-S-cluster containining protein